MSDHLHVVFRQFDLDGSGTINSEELQVLFAAIGIELSDQEALDTLQRVDVDGDDELDYKEFQQLMQMQLDGRSKILVEIWERFDRNGDGLLSIDELLELLSAPELDLRINARELRELRQKICPVPNDGATSGHVGQKALLRGLHHLPQIRAKGLSEACNKIRTIWDLLDSDHSGTVEVKELCCDFAGRRLMSMSEVSAMGAGTDAKSVVTWAQFLKAMHLNPSMIKKLNKMVEQAVAWDEEDARRTALQAKLTQDAIMKAAIGAPLDNEDAIDGMLNEKDKLDDWNTKHQLEAGAAANSMLGFAKGVASQLKTLIPQATDGRRLDKNRVQERLLLACHRLVLEAVRLVEGRDREPVDYRNCETSVSCKLTDLPTKTVQQEKEDMLKKLLGAAKKLWDTGELNGATALDNLRQGLCRAWLPKRMPRTTSFTERQPEEDVNPMVVVAKDTLQQLEYRALEEGAQHQFSRTRHEDEYFATHMSVSPVMNWPPPATPIRLHKVYHNRELSTPPTWRQTGSFHKAQDVPRQRQQRISRKLWQHHQRLNHGTKASTRFVLTPPMRTGRGVPNMFVINNNRSKAKSAMR